MSRLANIVIRAAVVAIFAVTRVVAQTSDASQHQHHPVEHARDESASKNAAFDDSNASSVDHVPPPPPQHAMTAMSSGEMADAMEMDDAASIATFRFDRLERMGSDDAATAWKLGASIGGDFDKLLIRSEGERAHGEFERSDAEVLWSHAVASYWDTELGVRRDFGRGADRSWAALGVQGLAPYGFALGATAYVGDAGRTALRFEVDYDLLLTQRLILRPRVEINAYGESDPAARVGSGFSDAQLGLRLRYELAREIAPYIGVERSWLFGDTAELAAFEDEHTAETRWVVGLQLWY